MASLALQDTNKRVIETLDIDDEVLDNINEQFVRIVIDNGIQTHSFQEARGTSVMRGKYEKVGLDDF